MTFDSVDKLHDLGHEAGMDKVFRLVDSRPEVFDNSLVPASEAVDFSIRISHQSCILAFKIKSKDFFVLVKRIFNLLQLVVLLLIVGVICRILIELLLVEIATSIEEQFVILRLLALKVERQCAHHCGQDVGEGLLLSVEERIEKSSVCHDIPGDQQPQPLQPSQYVSFHVGEHSHPHLIDCVEMLFKLSRSHVNESGILH